jgi:putative nucleotidyltransferase with HDIG domain
MMQRNEALEILGQYIKNENMFRHSLASEAVMRAMANELNENEEQWGLAGLLHDLDAEITAGNPKEHGLKTRELLKNKIDEESIQAIVMHNEEASGLDRSNKFEHALAAGETITGLITATALVYSDKRLASVKVKSISKRMKQKAFAASVKRENIMECELAGIPFDRFVGNHSANPVLLRP